MKRTARLAGQAFATPLRRWRPRAARLAVACAVLAVLGVTGCEKSFRNMYDQPRYKPLAVSPLWSDGRSARPPVEGTLPRSSGTAADTSSGRGGSIAPAPEPPFPVPLVATSMQPPSASAGRGEWTIAALGRGQQRFDIYCAPCHGAAGDGDGMIARRGFPHPPSLHDARLRAAADGHFDSVITHGYGAMYPYADRVGPADRRTIVGYIRALQLSRNATLADAPPAARATLERVP